MYRWCTLWCTGSSLPGSVCQWDLNNLTLFTRVLCAHCHYNNVITDALVALTNANRQTLQVVPRTSHSALVLSTLTLFVALEGKSWSSTTTSSLVVHFIPVVPRHLLALWIVPLNWSGHWSYVLPTEHSLISSPNSQRHVRMWVRQASSTILEVSSRHWIERRKRND